MREDVGLNARARGLIPHLVPRAMLDAWADTPDLPAFVRAMARSGPATGPGSNASDPSSFEHAVRQMIAAHVATLRRWEHVPSPAMAIVSGDLDRRSLRRVIRGAVHGTPLAARLQGLTPTPTFPERVLAELARQPSPRAVVGLLTVLRHPDARLLVPLVLHAQPDLFAIERVLLEGWASRSAALARGDRLLQQLTRLRIDSANAATALLVAGEPRDTPPGDGFVRGGQWLTEERFARAASAATPAEALVALRDAAEGTPLRPLIPSATADVDAIDRAFLSCALSMTSRSGRTEPTSSATLLRFLYLLEAQGRDLRALAWGATLGTPPAARRALLVTPWH